MLSEFLKILAHGMELEHCKPFLVLAHINTQHAVEDAYMFLELGIVSLGSRNHPITVFKLRNQEKVCGPTTIQLKFKDTK